ncbi:hypothetical protein CMI37_25395 [Candidatus Pacearchaeota archaeon]|nr:hypothetical protein [Candidatus Pacearchaeota archaeon]|tara:strand:+ start:1607 stop:2815 length:1209 start_codon:yes stop_codon:yes gene_type:complete
MNKSIKNILDKGTDIFNPQAKIIANADRALEFLQTGNTSPVLVEIDPSNTCNHACYFCISSYIHLPESKDLETFDRSVMPRDILMSACEDFVDMNVRAVNWTGGGEPTINRHIKEAITFLGRHKMKMGMFTNGTLLDKWDLFDTLVDNMTWVRFSVDSGTKETYESIRRPKKNTGWDKMISNLKKLIETNNRKGKKIDIGVGFVITPDTYKEIVDYAKNFKDLGLDYCQFKPEIVNREREGGQQRSVDFWNNEVEPLLREAKNILGDLFQINGYKLTDLEQDPTLYGRTYKKCLGSQISPCVGADGHVYVCTNHRGYKRYSYGSLYKKRFKEIWNDLKTREAIMNTINNVECFSKCTQLCKPHESNKIMWELHNSVNSKEDKDELLLAQEEIRKSIKHPEFI